MDRLTVVIITKNEEANIGKCIDAANGVADEILVIDSGSTDRTGEICLEKGVRFDAIDWQGYGGTKNLGNSMASNDWILSIDADEILSDELKQTILQAKNKFSGVYSFNRLTNYCGSWIRHCGWYPGVIIRLFNRKHVNWNERKVHEYLQFSADISVTHLKGDVYHYSYRSIKEHIERIKLYSNLGAAQFREQNKSGAIFKMLINPVWKFFKMYFIQLGFLDGIAGFQVCFISAYETMLRYRKAVSI